MPNKPADADSSAVDSPAALLTAVGCSAGRATGQVQTSPAAAEQACATGESVILVVEETTPADQHVMAQVAGVITARGGYSSHAAIVARSLGIPAICDARAVHSLLASSVGAAVDGTTITLDGETGEVWLGEVWLGDVADAAARHGAPQAGTDRPAQDGSMQTQDGPMQILATASNAADAKRARELGAAGIGLCRIEHIANSPQIFPLLQKLVAADLANAGLANTDLADADNSADGGETLAAFADGLRAELRDLLQAAGSLPVTVRLLDAPLRELVAAPAAERSGSSAQHENKAQYENNPMLGIRGIRLAHLRPDLYAAQVEALANAVADCTEYGDPLHGDPDSPIAPVVNVLLPMVSTAAEFAAGVDLVEQAWATATGVERPPTSAERPLTSESRPPIGVMIETPRAALIAGQLAELADFFSIGTNDLTQFTFAFSRDDLDARLISPYIEARLLTANPFATLDREGVGELIALACKLGRAVKPDLPIIMCGEHGADVESLAIAHELGISAVSCGTHSLAAAMSASAQLR